jgi:hypothetical protein
MLKELVDETAPRKSGELEVLATMFPATIVLFRFAVPEVLLMPPAQNVQVVLVERLLVTVTLVRFSVPTFKMPPIPLAVLPLTVELVSVTENTAASAC